MLDLNRKFEIKYSTEEKEFSRVYRESLKNLSTGLPQYKAIMVPHVVNNNPRFVRDLVNRFEEMLQKDSVTDNTIDFPMFVTEIHNMGIQEYTLNPTELGTLFLFNSTQKKMNSEQWIAAVTEILSIGSPNLDPTVGTKVAANATCCNFLNGRIPASNRTSNEDRPHKINQQCQRGLNHNSDFE